MITDWKKNTELTCQIHFPSEFSWLSWWRFSRSPLRGQIRDLGATNEKIWVVPLSNLSDVTFLTFPAAKKNVLVSIAVKYALQDNYAVSHNQNKKIGLPILQQKMNFKTFLNVVFCTNIRRHGHWLSSLHFSVLGTSRAWKRACKCDSRHISSQHSTLACAYFSLCSQDSSLLVCAFACWGGGLRTCLWLGLTVAGLRIYSN